MPIAITWDMAAWGAGIVATVVTSHVRLETKFGSHARQANARLAKVEQRTGLGPSNGSDSPLVNRGVCEVKHVALERELAQMRDENRSNFEVVRDELKEVRALIVQRNAGN